MIKQKLDEKTNFLIMNHVRFIRQAALSQDALVNIKKCMITRYPTFNYSSLTKKDSHHIHETFYPHKRTAHFIKKDRTNPFSRPYNNQ